jgi:putative ATP-dependent endonuclease of OLD family
MVREEETESWVLPELAQACGYDAAEGIRCVEFAQSGIRPLLRLAIDLGIQWHVLADGDPAGRSYAATAREFLKGRAAPGRITVLDEPDIVALPASTNMPDPWERPWHRGHAREQPRHLVVRVHVSRALSQGRSSRHC